MELKGLITLEYPGRKAIAAKAIVYVNEKTHMARLASEIPIDRLENVIRMSFGFSYKNIPAFIPQIPFECISLCDTGTVCFDVDCDELYQHSLGSETINNYDRMYSEIFIIDRSHIRGGMCYANEL